MVVTMIGFSKRYGWLPIDIGTDGGYTPQPSSHSKGQIPQFPLTTGARIGILRAKESNSTASAVFSAGTGTDPFVIRTPQGEK